MSTRGDFRFTVHAETATDSIFQGVSAAFAGRSKSAGILDIDGHPTHKARLIRQFAEEQKGDWRFLASCSPELNTESLIDAKGLPSEVQVK
jgi:hypothetical protein